MSERDRAWQTERQPHHTETNKQTNQHTQPPLHSHSTLHNQHPPPHTHTYMVTDVTSTQANLTLPACEDLCSEPRMLGLLEGVWNGMKAGLSITLQVVIRLLHVCIHFVDSVLLGQLG